MIINEIIPGTVGSIKISEPTQVYEWWKLKEKREITFDFIYLSLRCLRAIFLCGMKLSMGNLLIFLPQMNLRDPILCWRPF